MQSPNGGLKPIEMSMIPIIPVGSKLTKGKYSRTIEISAVKVCRKDIDLDGADKYGHWWIELDTDRDGKMDESYGWWPTQYVNLKETVSGVPGDLNGQARFQGSPTRDPHHGDRSSGVEVFKLYSPMTTTATIKAIQNFANNYNGDWSWPVGQNCHSFQKALLKENNFYIKP